MGPKFFAYNTQSAAEDGHEYWDVRMNGEWGDIHTVESALTENSAKNLADALNGAFNYTVLE